MSDKTVDELVCALNQLGLRTLSVPAAREISDLRMRANELAVEGDVVGAMMLDDIAYALEHGRDWSELLDDVAVRPPYVS